MSFLTSTGLPSWVVPALIVHIALVVVLILPAWRGFAFARLGGPTALLLIVPGAGLVLVALLMAGFALRRAGWPVASFLLLFVPVVNVLYMWMFGFGRWTTERARIQKRTAEAAARAATEDELSPSQRVVPAAGDTPPEANEAAGTADGAPAAVEATERPAEEPPAPPPADAEPTPPNAATDMPPVPEPAPQPEAEPEAEPAPAETPPEAPSAPPAAEQPPAPAPAPPSEEDMTHVAGANQPPEPTGWLIRGIDGRSQNFALKLQEADLLDADNGVLIGRSSRADFIINDESVSRNHARLVPIKNKLCVEDLDSMNGTWIGGARLESRAPTQLPVGTEFAIGKVNLRVDPA